ncbi:hypothetical protein D5086_029093 [Populus alba]|uniref:Uncharacterized protein n=1 Tax=Populus alba TaxID=43335 RepID=A0ACC4ASH8_POPAL
MVHSYRYHQLKKGDRQHVEEEEVLLSSLMCAASSVYFNRTRPKLFSLVILSLLSCCLILSPPLFCSSSLSYSFDVESDGFATNVNAKAYLCSSISNGLIAKTENFRINHHCDVMHDVPAVLFSTGGYTGNVYHEFNDGILPLYITSQHFKKKVVFVILDYHNWWIMKYGNILSLLSDYPAIDFNGDKKTHCFPEAIAGLRIHDELTVDPSLMQENKSVVDFRNFLDRAYWPRIKSMIKEEERGAQKKLELKAQSSKKNQKQVHEATLKKPKLVILSRNGSRAITNENLLVKMAEEIGFRVEVMRPEPTTELARIYRALNSSEVMIGVHGAAMTHFLFMKPGSVFIQVIPLGTEWAADAYYGKPARKLGLKYIGYQILPRESSLYDKYDKNDPVLRDPRSVSDKGWQYTKSIYLDNQNVRLNLGRFQRRLLRAYRYSFAKVNSRYHLHSQ